MLRNILIIASIVSLAIIVNSQTQNHTYTVYKVYDGDTLTARNKTDNTLFRIRLICADAAEKNQNPWGDIAQKRLSALLPIDSTLTLRNSSIDMYGRTLAAVISKDNINVNEKLVEEGLLVWYYKQRGCNSYEAIQNVAKAAKLGVWSDPTFVMPWIYRQNNTATV